MINPRLLEILLNSWASREAPQTTRDKARNEGFNITTQDVIQFWRREDRKVDHALTSIDDHVEFTKAILGMD